MRAFQIFGSTNKVGCKNEIIIIKKQIKAPKKFDLSLQNKSTKITFVFFNYIIIFFFISLNEFT